MLDFISELLTQYEGLLVTVGVVSAVVFVVSLALTPWLLGKIPADYFVVSNPHKSKDNFIIKMLKNAFGLLLLLAGIIMLVTPGQGIISILLGLFLMDFPQKRQLELKLINHNPTFKTLNWVRQKFNHPPLKR
ncbi:hypothetical protein SPBRAN_2075 [uncultured Candidatus Thioglobus sp.]|nr:hypothetical protein SPBRAN_2075 [uncultured Candidatus Thioglobus sp.]